MYRCMILTPWRVQHNYLNVRLSSHRYAAMMIRNIIIAKDNHDSLASQFF